MCALVVCAAWVCFVGNVRHIRQLGVPLVFDTGLPVLLVCVLPVLILYLGGKVGMKKNTGNEGSVRRADRTFFGSGSCETLGGLVSFVVG